MVPSLSSTEEESPPLPPPVGKYDFSPMQFWDFFSWQPLGFVFFLNFLCHLVHFSETAWEKEEQQEECFSSHFWCPPPLWCTFCQRIHTQWHRFFLVVIFFTQCFVSVIFFFFSFIFWMFCAIRKTFLRLVQFIFVCLFLFIYVFFFFLFFFWKCEFLRFHAILRLFSFAKFLFLWQPCFCFTPPPPQKKCLLKRDFDADKYPSLTLHQDAHVTRLVRKDAFVFGGIALPCAGTCVAFVVEF